MRATIEMDVGSRDNSLLVKRPVALRYYLCYVTGMLKKTQCPDCKRMSYSPTFGCLNCPGRDVTDPVSDVTIGHSEEFVTLPSQNSDVTAVSNVTECKTCAARRVKNAERQKAYRERKKQ